MLAAPALRLTFVLVQAALIWLALDGPGNPLGDVEFVYRFWVDLGVSSNYWVGIDAPWVYPIVAMVPMLAANAFGAEHFGLVWLIMVAMLNGLAFVSLTGFSRKCRNAKIAWWWIAFLALLGPIAITRIDSVTVPLAIIGVVLLRTQPHSSAILLAFATWMKVWPAALIAAIVIASKDRSRAVGGAIGLSVVVFAVALSLGAGLNVFSFIGEQSGRGLQVEAPVSLFWLWQAAANVPGAEIVYDRSILTFEVNGDGVDDVAALMTPLLAIVGSGIVLLAIIAVRRGAAERQVLPQLSLALICALIAVNKVGSPQFISWLAVPMILGLLWRPEVSPWRSPVAWIMLVIAGATQLLYPYLYNQLIALNPVMLAVLTARNLLLFVVLALAIRSLILTIRRADASTEVVATEPATG